jgi:hypothetical protein
VFDLRAANSLVWRTDEIVLPDGEAIHVWFDGDRGRVGYADGRVFASNSRVQIAPALPTGAPVRQYAETCGRAFAAANDGLWSLQSDGLAAEGTWVQEQPAMDLLVDGLGGKGVEDAKLYELDGGLMYGSRYGGLVEISPACP